MIFWIVLFLVLCYVLIERDKTEKGDSAFDILKRRYASGEITRDEYLRVKKEI